MRPRSVLYVSTAIAVYLFVVQPWRPHHGESLAQIDKLFCGSLAQEASMDSVMGFLNKQMTPYSDPGHGDPVIYAHLGNTCSTVIFGCSTDVRYQFDGSNRLLSCKAEQALDGP
jgi:hypothetical protein